MYIIGMIILTFFAVIGVAAFIGAIGRAMMRTGGDMLLVLPSLGADNAEARVRYAATLCEQENGTAVICLCEPGSEVADICERMKIEYPCITVTDNAHFGNEQKMLSS